MSNLSNLTHEERRCLLKPLISVNRSINLMHKSSYEISRKHCNSLCQYLKERDLHELYGLETPERSNDEYETREGKSTVADAFYADCIDAFMPCTGELKDCIGRKYPELYNDAIDMMWSENVFVISAGDYSIERFVLYEEVLDTLSRKFSRKIRYLACRLDSKYQQGWILHDESRRMLLAWKVLMERLQEALSWNQLHLNMIFQVRDRAGTAFIADIVRSLSQVKSCGISIRKGFELSFKGEAKALMENLAHPKPYCSDAGTFGHEFKFYNALPKELRLLVLSFTGLVPCKDGETDNEWHLYGTQWLGDRQDCCSKCGGDDDSLLCCCKWRHNTYSTSCICTDLFWPILGVSRQFRAEALNVLFKNRFEFSGANPQYLGSTFFSSMKQFLCWKPTTSHLRFMKDARLLFGLSELEGWDDDSVNFNTELTEILRTFVENNTSSNIVTLDLGGIKMSYEEHWNDDGWRRLQIFQDNLCTILEQLYTTHSASCKIFIDWTKWRPFQDDDSKASERDAKAREMENVPLIDEETGQRMWRKSDWIKNAPVEMSVDWPNYGPDACFVHIDSDDWD